MGVLVGFESLGISARSFPPKLVGSEKGPGLVVATAACVWDDIQSVGIEQVRPDGLYGYGIVTINDMAMYWPGVVHHHYSNQHRWIPHWTQARRETISGYVVREKWGQIGMTHSCISGGQYQWPWPGHGTSTLNGVYTALALGYDPVIICGAPLDNSRHFFEPPWARSNFEREVGKNIHGEMMYWADSARRIFKGRVFSQSGRTKELLGAWR